MKVFVGGAAISYLLLMEYFLVNIRILPQALGLAWSI